MPTQDQVDKFFALKESQNETHYLNNSNLLRVKKVHSI